LFVQIPCLDEAETLPRVLEDLPKHIDGVDSIEVLVIDDGSSDATSDVAREHGVRHVVRFPARRGLAYGFMAGLDACLRLGADIVVNTDGDHQYRGADLEALIRPILDGKADLVVGDRQVRTVAGFSRSKKVLQVLGSWVVRRFSGTSISDATSGFRAIGREAASRLFVIGELTYTLETLIQAGAGRMSVVSVPVATNPPTRESRLFRTAAEYVGRSAVTILRAYTMYRPLQAFLSLALVCLTIGVLIAARFLYYFLTADGYTGHIQSLILAAILMILAFLLALLGVLGDLIAANRRMLEDVRKRLIRLEETLVQRDRRGRDK
jgi:glycosyltransferase involved in cell wall biosynthesis